MDKGKEREKEMIITRKDVIKAIKKESLKRGDFVHDYYKDQFGNWKEKNDPNCKVCAVGAVLRNKGYSNKQINVTVDNFAGDWTGDWRTELQCENYLAALSSRFEQSGGGKKLVEWVKKHMPKQFKVKL